MTTMTRDPCSHCPHPEPDQCPGRQVGARLCDLTSPNHPRSAEYRRLVANQMRVEPSSSSSAAAAATSYATRANEEAARIEACPHREPFTPDDPDCWCPRWRCAAHRYHREWMKPPNGVYASDCAACLAGQSVAGTW